MCGVTPFGKLSRMLDTFDDDFFKSGILGGNMPCKVDIRENDNAYIVDMELPGFSKDEITIDVVDDRLTVKAEHKETENNTTDERYIHKERIFKAYQRSFVISDIDSAKTEAAYVNGILTITLFKKVEEAPVSHKVIIQ